MMKRSILFFLSLFSLYMASAANPYDNPDTIVVARDGTGQFRTVAEAVEVCRAFMDYHKVIYIKKGTYKEKLIIPQSLTNIELCGESRDETIITWDDHANINKMGTFRTYTMKVEGSMITFKNLTIENNAARLGQAVALHTEGDMLTDTIYTGNARTRLYFKDCHIEGTTDFIFGPATAWFEHCFILCKINSYITAASTPKDVPYGYIFNDCTIRCAEGVDKVYLGRPWRDYGYTLFMNCDLPRQIRPEGWHHWQKSREATARYLEYNNRGEGAATQQRVSWSHQLTKKEAQKITLNTVFSVNHQWLP